MLIGLKLKFNIEKLSEKWKQNIKLKFCFFAFDKNETFIKITLCTRQKLKNSCYLMFMFICSNFTSLSRVQSILLFKSIRDSLTWEKILPYCCREKVVSAKTLTNDKFWIIAITLILSKTSSLSFVEKLDDTLTSIFMTKTAVLRLLIVSHYANMFFSSCQNIQ